MAIVFAIIDIIILCVINNKEKNIFLLEIIFRKDINDVFINVLNDPDSLKIEKFKHKLIYIPELLVVIIFFILDLAWGNVFIMAFLAEAIFVHSLYERAKDFCFRIDMRNDVYCPKHGVPDRFEKGTFALIRENEHAIKVDITNSGQQIEWHTGPKLVYFKKSGLASEVTFYKHIVITAMNLQGNSRILDDNSVIYISDFFDIVNNGNIAIVDEASLRFVDDGVVNTDQEHYKRFGEKGLYIRHVGNIRLSIVRKTDGQEFATNIGGLDYIKPYTPSFIGINGNKVVYGCDELKIVNPTTNGYILSPEKAYIRVECGRILGNGNVNIILNAGLAFNIVFSLSVGIVDKNMFNPSERDLLILINLAQGELNVQNFIDNQCVARIQNTMNMDTNLIEVLNKSIVQMHTLLHYYKESLQQVQNENILYASSIMAEMKTYHEQVKANVSTIVNGYINQINNGLFSYSVRGTVTVTLQAFGEMINICDEQYNNAYKYVSEQTMTPEIMVQIMNALNGATPGAIRTIMGVVDRMRDNDLVRTARTRTVQQIKNIVNNVDSLKYNLSKQLQKILGDRVVLDVHTRQNVTVDVVVDTYLTICKQNNAKGDMNGLQQWLMQQDKYKVGN